VVLASARRLRSLRDRCTFVSVASDGGSGAVEVESAAGTGLISRRLSSAIVCHATGPSASFWLMKLEAVASAHDVCGFADLRPSSERMLYKSAVYGVTEWQRFDSKTCFQSLDMVSEKTRVIVR
jgi:hypothetical protein